MKFEFEQTIEDILDLSKKNYFLYLGNTQALIIPKRVVGSEEDRIALEEFVNDRIGND